MTLRNTPCWRPDWGGALRPVAGQRIKDGSVVVSSRSPEKIGSVWGRCFFLWTLSTFYSKVFGTISGGFLAKSCSKKAESQGMRDRRWQYVDKLVDREAQCCYSLGCGKL